MYEGCFLKTKLSKILNCSLIERLSRAFVSKYMAKPMKRSAELFKHSADLFGFKRKLKAQLKV